MDRTAIAAIARRQHGLVTRAQALEHGTPRQLDAAITRGELEIVRRTVYRTVGTPESWRQHLLAVCLASGPGTVASFRSAAALWALPGFDAEILEITVPARQRTRLDGVHAHDSRVSGLRHVATLDRIPVSSPARVLCDLSALSTEVSPWMIERAVDDALRRKIVTMKALERVARDLAGRGRRRSTVTRAIVEARTPGYHPGESEPEKRIADLLERRGLPRPLPQHRVRVGRRTLRVDLAYPELAIAIEYDSDAFHRTKSQLEADARRRNLLRLAGMTVLEFTSASSDREVIETVHAARLRASVA
jgi:hypothetical protein